MKNLIMNYQGNITGKIAIQAKPCRKRLAMILFFLLLILSTGCASRGEKPRAQLPGNLPANWTAHFDKSELSISTTLMELIRDESLQTLVREALVNNPDLNATALRLKASGYMLSGPRSRLRPRLNAGFSRGRNNQGVDGETGELTTANSNRLSVGVSWEMDLWGRLADEYAASNYAFQEQEFDYLYARDALAVRVIQAWIEQVVIQRSLLIEAERLKVLKHMEAVLVERYTDGIGNLDELSTAGTRTQIAKADVSALNGSLKRAIRKLEVLLGRYPEGELPVSEKLPEVLTPPVDAPAEVLLHRPDIQAALARVKTASYVSSSTQKAMLPELCLSGQVFKEAVRLDDIGGALSYWDILGSLFQPLFEGGRLKDEARARETEFEASLKELHGLVLRALKEVEDAFDLEQELAVQFHALANAIEEAEKSSRYYQERYRQGLDDIQSLLIAKEQEMSVKIRYNELLGQRLINRIDLALVLGVGLNDPQIH